MSALTVALEEGQPWCVTTIGERIREARGRAKGPEGKRMTQAELAQAVGVQPMQVSRWERDEQQPKSDHVGQLAQTLGCDANWLLTGLEPSAPPDMGDDESPPGYHEFVEHFGHMFDTELVERMQGRFYGRFGLTAEEMTAKRYLSLAQWIEEARGK